MIESAKNLGNTWLPHSIIMIECERFLGAALNHMMECAARIKPGFLPQSIIFLSQAVRARTEQIAAECLRCRFAPWSGGLRRA